MMPLRQQRSCPGALTTVLVGHDRLRNINDLPAGPAQTQAQIDVLEIQKEALVEELCPSQGAPANEHGGAQSPVHFCKAGMIPSLH